MWRWRWFRSPYFPCFSVNHVTRERVKGAIAAPLTIPAPGKKIAASRIVRPVPGAHPFGASASAVQNCSRQFCPQLIPPGFRVGHQPASMQAMPSRRVPAPRPGLPETLRRFSAGPRSRCKAFVFLLFLHRCFFGFVGRVRRSRHPALLSCCAHARRRYACTGLQKHKTSTSTSTSKITALKNRKKNK